MRRFDSGIFPSVFFSFLLILGLAACGGSSTPNLAGIPNTANMTPPSASLVFGDVITLSVTANDANGIAITSPKLTFSSSNTSLVNVSSNGDVCAGTWDTSFIVCTPGTLSGTATITVTVESSVNGKVGSATTSSLISVHPRVDQVVVSPSSVNCVSLGGTQQMTAQAFANGQNVTNLVGNVIWSASDTSIAIIDSNGLVTAKQPGLSTINAFVGAVSSLPASFITCPVKSIFAHVQSGSATSFSFPGSGFEQLTADVIDANNNPISPTLAWETTQPFIATVDTTGAITASQPGATVISAVCAPPNCNTGLTTVYSNAFQVTVNGTIGGATIYASGTGATSVVPIDFSSNTAGTAIALPVMPNSFVRNVQNTVAYLGGASELMQLALTSNTVSSPANVIGNVIAVSPDNNRVIVSDTISSPNSVTVVGVGGTASDVLPVNGTAADWLPDSSKAFLVGTANGVPTLYAYQPSTALKHYALTATANDVSVLPNGAFAYVAGGAPSSVTVRASCDNSLADTVATPGIPSMIRALPNGTAVLALDSPNIDIITPTSSLLACPPPVSDTVVSTNLGLGAFVPKSLLILPNSTKAYIAADIGLLVFDLTTKTATKLTLANGAMPLSLAVTNDSATLYVGGSDNAIHVITVSTGTDGMQIGVPFTPDLLVVQTK